MAVAGGGSAGPPPHHHSTAGRLVTVVVVVVVAAVAGVPGVLPPQVRHGVLGQAAGDGLVQVRGRGRGQGVTKQVRGRGRGRGATLRVSLLGITLGLGVIITLITVIQLIQATRDLIVIHLLETRKLIVNRDQTILKTMEFFYCNLILGVIYPIKADAHDFFVLR